MRKSIVVATRNKGKAAEFRDMLAPLGYEVLSLLDLPDGAAPDVEEDGDTFAANAEKKAREAAIALGRPTLADDSGLAVDALGGAPGVYSARYAGEPSDDARNNAKLLRELGVAGERREVAARTTALSAARFVCVLALYDPETNGTTFAEGVCEGYVLDQARGAGGFGYDPLFYVPSLGKTFGEASAAEKHAISHRGAALRALVAKLSAR